MYSKGYFLTIGIKKIVQYLTYTVSLVFLVHNAILMY